MISAKSLFVTAFFAQWWAMALYGIWQMLATVPQTLFQFEQKLNETTLMPMIERAMVTSMSSQLGMLRAVGG